MIPSALWKLSGTLNGPESATSKQAQNVLPEQATALLSSTRVWNVPGKQRRR